MTKPAQRAEIDPLAFAPFTRARRMRAELVAGILRAGRAVPDETFDELYPDAVRRVSSFHWTPVRVCFRVAELLRLGRGERILDIGAGAGKFSIVAAVTSGACVRGVEREPLLADVAREAARRFGVDVEIVDGTFENEDPASFDAVYLFNPFVEMLLLPGLARDVPPDRFGARVAADVAAAERFLASMRAGSRLVTYCGFGGKVPPTFERRSGEPWDGGILELWEKR
jgi:SAM-dependent methyltransferase